MEKCGGPQVTQAPTEAARLPAFAKLPGKYKLPQHAIYPAAASGSSTAEDEFDRYKSGPLSPGTIELVDFWNASVVFLYGLFHSNQSSSIGSKKRVSKALPGRLGLPSNPSVFRSLRARFFICGGN